MPAPQDVELGTTTTAPCSGQDPLVWGWGACTARPPLVPTLGKKEATRPVVQFSPRQQVRKIQGQAQYGVTGALWPQEKALGRMFCTEQCHSQDLGRSAVPFTQASPCLPPSSPAGSAQSKLLSPPHSVALWVKPVLPQHGRCRHLGSDWAPVTLFGGHT